MWQWWNMMKWWGVMRFSLWLHTPRPCCSGLRNFFCSMLHAVLPRCNEEIAVAPCKTTNSLRTYCKPLEEVTHVDKYWRMLHHVAPCCTMLHHAACARRYPANYIVLFTFTAFEAILIGLVSTALALFPHFPIQPLPTLRGSLPVLFIKKHCKGAPEALRKRYQKKLYTSLGPATWPNIPVSFCSLFSSGLTTRTKC